MEKSLVNNKLKIL